jgi:hypothetical protein
MTLDYSYEPDPETALKDKAYERLLALEEKADLDEKELKELDTLRYHLMRECREFFDFID